MVLAVEVKPASDGICELSVFFAVASVDTWVVSRSCTAAVDVGDALAAVEASDESMFSEGAVGSIEGVEVYGDIVSGNGVAITVGTLEECNSELDFPAVDEFSSAVDDVEDGLMTGVGFDVTGVAVVN